jgi:PAS domain S-box-containing protein
MSDFMPHGYCYFSNPLILWLHVISDSLITVSYFCIPSALIYLVRRRRDLPFNSVFWMFGLFITGCGATHLMEVWTVWHPSYLLAGIVKAMTATVSVATALVLIPLIPEASALPGPEHMRDLNERGQAEARLAEQTEEVSRQAAELIRSQQALESQKLMLQSVLDSMAEGLVAADEHGKFIIWNPAAERILGSGTADLPSQEWTPFYGLYLEDMVTPFPADQLPLVRAIRGEASTAEMFVRNPKLDHDVWIEVSGCPLMDKHGVVRGGVAAFRDITRRKADEQEIRQLNDQLEARIAKRTAQLEAANRELESFSYSVSHDLRAPLRHIAGFTGILLEEFSPSLDPQACLYLQRIQQGTRRMGVLVDDLLNLARLGRQSLKLQVVSLNNIVNEVISLLQPEYERRNVEWRIAHLPSLECDQVLMGQVFQNLLANALKYSRPRADVVIEIGAIEEEGKPSVIFIRDNGVGFNMKYADKLFGVFQRLHSAEDFEGTGVGLACVDRIIRKHGGRIWAEAEPDHGATFYFTVEEHEPVALIANLARAGAEV